MGVAAQRSSTVGVNVALGSVVGEAVKVALASGDGVSRVEFALSTTSTTDSSVTVGGTWRLGVALQRNFWRASAVAVSRSASGVSEGTGNECRWAFDNGLCRDFGS